MGETKIFFASDVHGSEKAYMKFINAGKFYKVDIVILGGDLTGKMIIPIVKQPDSSYKAVFLGSECVVKNTEELERLEKNIRFNGFYPYRTTLEEKERLDDAPEKVDGLFSQLMVEGIQRWVSLAEERLKGTGIKCYIMPGNDDRFEIDKVLTNSTCVIDPEGTIVKIDEHHEMISTGFSNITPWNAPRECPEEDLAKKIEDMVSQVKNIENCIFNLHCPPINSRIDAAPKLDKQLRPILSPSGGFEMIPAGSTSVRRAIEEHQPLLGLHGHIHESKGFCRIGRTLCLNPGSEYSEGILRGAIIAIDEKKVKSFILTRG
jgi:hypothetical protein